MTLRQTSTPARNRHARLAFALGLVICALTGLRAFAVPNDAQDARDAATVAATTLDMDTARRIAAVGHEAQQAVSQSCMLRGNGKDASLDDCIAQVARQPQIAAALARHGLSARRYALGMSALIAGEFGAQILASDGDAARGRLSEFGINPAHVRFVQAHRTELDALFGTLRLR